MHHNTDISSKQERYRGARAKIAEWNALLLQSIKDGDIEPQHLKLHPDIFSKLLQTEILDTQAIYCISRPLIVIKPEHWAPDPKMKPLRDADSKLATLLVELFQWVIWTESIQPSLVMSITILAPDELLRLGQYRMSQIREWSTKIPVTLLCGNQPKFWDVLHKCGDVDDYTGWGAPAWWIH